MADLPAAIRTELLACIRKTGRSQAHIARTIGISPKHLSQLLTGQARFSMELANRIAFACGRELRVSSVRLRRPVRAALTESPEPEGENADA